MHSLIHSHSFTYLLFIHIHDPIHIPSPGERDCSSGRGVVKRCPTGLANPYCVAKVEKFQNGTESE